MVPPRSSRRVPDGAERCTDLRFIPPASAVRLGSRLGEDPRTTALDGRERMDKRWDASGNLIVTRLLRYRAISMSSIS